VAAGIAETIGLALVAMATAWWTAVAGGIVMGLGFSMLYPSLALVVVERMPASQRGAGLGAFTAFFDAGVGLGGPLAGAIAALAGYPAAFWAAAGFGATAALISAHVARMPTPASSPA
jgi:MFS family permease